MKKQEFITNLKNKSEDELNQELSSLRHQLLEARLKKGVGKLKDVRLVERLRRKIAQASTFKIQKKA